jgi:hypothetical protein
MTGISLLRMLKQQVISSEDIIIRPRSPSLQTLGWSKGMSISDVAEDYLSIRKRECES